MAPQLRIRADNRTTVDIAKLAQALLRQARTNTPRQVRDEQPAEPRRG